MSILAPEAAREALQNLYKQKEEHIREAMLELVSRGLIAIETSGLERVDYGNGRYSIKERIKLVPREKEYIELLEQKLKLAIEALETCKGYLDCYTKVEFGRANAIAGLREIKKALAKINQD